MKAQDLAGMEPIDIIGAINTGEQIIGATLPLITDIIAKIQAANHSDNVHTPAGRTNHILATEALDKLQNAKIELHDKYFAQLIAKGVIEE